VRKLLLTLLILALTLPSSAFSSKKAKYMRAGNPADKVVQPFPGFSLQGGGDNDEAFRYLCSKANGGDIVVLRARGNDEYNKDITKLCPSANSVATLILPSRASASDPIVTQALSHAECIFFSGGDQAKYITNWKNTPVQIEVNKAIARGVPIGGTSAGLAVLGEFVFSALNDTAVSPVTLADPYDKTVTIDRGFLSIPLLQSVITDTHFIKRDRMGRLLVFMARILKENSVATLHAIAVDEDGALTLDTDGSMHLLGDKNAFMLTAQQQATQCTAGKPLTFGPVSVYRLQAGSTFNVNSWTGSNGTAYQLRVDNGKVISTQPGGNIY
jgi:cyanophycinase